MTLERLDSFFAFVFLARDARLRPGWRALLFLPAFGVLVIVGSALLGGLVGAEWLRADFELRLLATGFIGLVSGWLASWALLRALDRRSFRTLGLWAYEGWSRELGLGLLAGFALVTLIVGPLWLAGRITFVSVQLDAAGAASALAWSLLLLVPAAASEEVLFRGYPFQRLVEAWGPAPPVLLLSALFGLGHLDNPAATPFSTANTALIGILLALMYLKTRGLWLPIGFHFAWNFTMGFVYALPVSGFVLSGQPWATRIGGPAWLTGGNYGPEGSVLTTGVAVGAALWLLRTRRLGVSPALARDLQ